MQPYNTCHGTVTPNRTKKLEITLDRRSDLSPGKIESFLRLIDTPEKRRNFLTDLCTLREYLDKMFNCRGSRFEQKKSHPAYGIMITANEIIGSLFLVGDNLKYTPTGNGVVVEVVGPRKYEETCPMPILKSFKEYKECKGNGCSCLLT